jgi:hypothetical protein
MSQDASFKKLARRAYLSYHQDGLLDLLIGWIMVTLGVSIATAWAWAWGVVCWMMIALYVPLKNRITIPRFGYVEFTPKPRREVLKKVVYPLAFCIFMVILLLGAGVPGGALPPAEVWTPSDVWPFLRDSFRPWLQEYQSLLSGFGALIVLGMVGLATEIRRLFVYALMSLVLMTGAWLLGLRMFIPLFVVGGSIMAVGGVMLAQFVRRYPIPPSEEIDHAAR